jgi:hypothetical protein
MRKFVLTLLVFFGLTVAAYGSPFLACDPQTGVEEYELCFDLDVDGVYETCMILPAEADGSLLYDVGSWGYGHGWFNGNAKASDTYAVIDDTTGNLTEVKEFSDPSPFQLKIPNKGDSATGYRIKP